MWLINRPTWIGCDRESPWNRNFLTSGRSCKTRERDVAQSRTTVSVMTSSRTDAASVESDFKKQAASLTDSVPRCTVIVNFLNKPFAMHSARILLLTKERLISENLKVRAMMREMSSEGRFEKWSLGWGGRGNPFLGVWRSV